ncbi:MAG: ABC transporter substrate-binding protein [Clostridia bacterium]|nr:ABC transporter substrate-binding protein [Clostridia bacterium]
MKLIRLMIAATLTITLLAVFALPAFAAPATETLNVYNWGVYMDLGNEDGEVDVNAAFEAWYKEKFGVTIEVNYTTYDTNETMYQKVVAGGAPYDIVIPSDYMISRMIKENLLLELDFSNIPNYQTEISDEFKGDAWQYDPEHKYTVPYMWGYVGIVYNRNHVPEKEYNYDLLWDKTYAGKILMMNNPRDTFAIALAKNGYSLNTTEPSHWEKAYEDLKAQKPLVQSYVTDEIFDKMQSGEAYVSPCYYGDYLVMRDAQAEDVDLAFSPIVGQTTNKYVDCMCVPVTAQNKTAAERYMDFMCTYEMGVANANYTGYSSPLNSVKNNKGDLEYYYEDDEYLYPTAETLAQYEEFLYLDKTTQTRMDNQWKNLKSSELGPWPYVISIGVIVGASAAFVVHKEKEKRAEILRQKAREKYAKLHPFQ